MRSPLLISLLSLATLAADAGQSVMSGSATRSVEPSQRNVLPRDTMTRTSTGTVRGRVIDGHTAAPLRRVQVRISSNELQESRVVITDAQGRYEVTDLPAGRYNVSASKGGYVLLVFGQKRPFEPGRPIELHAGEVLEKIDFGLPRGAAVDGRIVDEVGEPVADVVVMAMRSQYAAGRRRLVYVGRPAMTNDRGEYRLYGLPPGQYYISATVRASASGESTGGSGYAATYYPGTPNLAEATPVRLALAQDAKDIEVALAIVHTGTMSGTAFDSDGRPFGGGIVSASQTVAGLSFVATSAPIKADGSFSLSGVTPGDYVVQAASSNGVLADATSGDTASTRISFAGGDESDIRLVARKPISVSGRIVPDQPARWLPSSFQLRAVPASADDAMSQNGVTWRVRDDWSFDVKLPRWVALLRMAAGPRGVVLKSVMLDGVEAADAGVDLTTATEVRGVEVFLTDRSSELSGGVTTRDGAAVSDFVVIAFSQDRERWKFQSRYFGGTRSDASGQFRIRGLPAGDYFVAALDTLDVGQATDPEVLDRLAEAAARVTIRDGESKTMTLVLSTESR